jgi:hypothetical protein
VDASAIFNLFERDTMTAIERLRGVVEAPRVWDGTTDDSGRPDVEEW